MFCVFVGSVIAGGSKLDNSTRSITAIRASDRASRAGNLRFDDVGSNGTVPPAFRQQRISDPLA